MPEKDISVKDLQKKVEELSRKLEEKELSCIESRESFEKALLASPDAVSIIDFESFTIQEVNKQFEENFGYTREETLGKTSLELNIWKYPEERDKLLEDLKKHGSISDLEISFRHKSGHIGQVLLSCETIHVDGKDCVLAYFKSLNDIIDAKNHYELLAENSTDVIWTMNLDGSFAYISPSVKRLRGYTPEEVMSQSIMEVLTLESAQKVQILLKEIIKHETKGLAFNDSYLTEVQQLCKDGSTVWTEVITSPIRDKDGKLTHILGVSRNIQGKKIAEEKARERSNTLEGIFRSAPLGMGMVINREFKFVNDRFCKMIGYSRKEIIGKNARFIYESDKEYKRVGEVKYKLIKEEGTGDLYTKLVKKDGSLIDVLLSSSPVDINDWGKGMVFNILDMSDLKDAETKLAENKEKYTSLFNHINDAILVHPWKEDGFADFVEVNEIACKMYGYTRDELLKMKANHLTREEDAIEHSSKEFRAAILRDGAMMFESVHIKKNGEEFPVEISSNIIEIEGEQIILAVVRDISERKKAEKDIYETELRYREFFENSPEPMVTMDKLGFVTSCNSAFLKIAGKDSTAVLKKHFSKLNLISQKNIPEYLKIFSSIIASKKNMISEFDWHHPDGSQRKAEARLAPIIKNNKTVGIQAQLKDITKQKEFEANLILAKEKAEDSDMLKSSFLETMSHELRTPLNAVIGFSNLIEDEPELKGVKEMNRYVTENGKKLLNIIESIFDISMLETQTAILKSEEFSLNDLFSELEITLNGMIELEHKTEINTYYQPDRRTNDFSVITDKQRLKQLLSNLLTNAVRYTDRGSIRYGYSKKNNEIEFFVTDTGIGIPLDKQDIIFKKFSQVDNSSTRTRGGVGLGLSIVEEIAKLLGGKLRLDSTLMEGSTFYFTMPMKPFIKSDKNTYGKELSGKNFLIVEDVESNYLYLERLLTESGASVLWAQTGSDAITIAENLDSLDLILMDIRMPDMNGYDITRAIKKARPQIPIVAQTAYAMLSDQEEAIDAGCIDHISKPIRVEDLMSTVKKHLSIEKVPGIVI